MKWTYNRYDVEESRIYPSGLAFRPEVRLRVIGGLRGCYLRTLIDTGADHSLLPFSVAEIIGAELFDDEQDIAKGISGRQLETIPGKVELELSSDDDVEIYRWSAVVGFAKFASEANECSVLGHAGCLEYFLTTYDGPARIIELVPQANFPGVIL